MNDTQTRDAELTTASFERTITITRMSEDEEARTVEIAFSSEEPYERFFGIEVLSHEPQSVRLDRLNNGAAVLVDHNHRDQVGVVESARVDGDKKGRAVIRFGRSPRAEEIWQDVKDAIRTKVSVGYRILKYETEEREGMKDLVTVTAWEPFELSLVSVPADDTVGVGRSANEQFKPETQETKTMSEQKAVEQETKNTAPAATAAPEFDAEKERTSVRTSELKRMESIRSLADKHQLPDLGREAIDSGWTLEKFQDEALKKIGERNNAARAESGHDGEVDLSKRDRQQFSIIRLMDALANPNDRAAQQRAGFELEVSAEAARKFGPDFQVRGSFIPQTLLSGQRDLSAGTATDGAELVASNLLSGSYIEVLRNASAAMRAGITYLPGLVGNVDIPRQTSSAAGTWISSEGGDATESEPQFDQVSLSPKDVAAYTEVTRRLRQQSTPAIEGIVRRDLAVAAALAIDLGVLYGSASSGQPRGLTQTVGINTKDLSAADPTYAEIVEIIRLVMEDNALTGTPTWIIEANGWEALSTTPKQGSGVEGNFILGDNDRIKGYPYVMSNQVTNEEYFFGDFSQMLLGEWGGLEINVDPYTKALSGTVRYVMFKTCDVACRQPTAFCYAHDGIA